MRKPILLTILSALASFVLVRPGWSQNICIEDGPFYGAWSCILQGASNTLGTLNLTTIDVCVNATIVKPVVVSQPTFYNGLMKRALTFRCSDTTIWQTNVVRYFPGPLYFPTMPTLLTNAATNVYAALVDGRPTSLLGWWPGQNNANDIFGGYNGVLHNGTTFTSGKVGQAFSFDGTNDCVTNAVRWLTNAQDSYTMEFWAWPTAGRASTVESVSGYAGIVNQRYAIFPRQGGSSRAGSGVSVGTNGVSVFEHGDFYLPSLLVYNTTITNWTHIAVVYSNRQPKLYLNGVLVRTGLTSQRPSHPSCSFGEDGTGYGYYKGLLDEVSIYSCALSTNDIQAIYQAGSAGKQWTNSPPGASTLPLDCVCSPITVQVAAVTVRSWANADSDGDGMPDCWEVQHGLNPLVNDAEGDADGDRYSNLLEYMEGTAPNNASDHPNWPGAPGSFVFQYSTNAASGGSTNFYTSPPGVKLFGPTFQGTNMLFSYADTSTNASSATTNQAWQLYWKADLSTNVAWQYFATFAAGQTNLTLGGLTNATAFFLLASGADLDHDGLPDNWEVNHGLDPNNSGDANGNSSTPGLTNLECYQRGLDPHVNYLSQGTGTMTYEYDAIGRLLHAVQPTTQRFQPDAEGNVQRTNP